MLYVVRVNGDWLMEIDAENVAEAILSPEALAAAEAGEGVSLVSVDSGRVVARTFAAGAVGAKPVYGWAPVRNGDSVRPGARVRTEDSGIYPISEV